MPVSSRIYLSVIQTIGLQLCLRWIQDSIVAADGIGEDMLSIVLELLLRVSAAVC